MIGDHVDVFFTYTFFGPDLEEKEEDEEVNFHPAQTIFVYGGHVRMHVTPHVLLGHMYAVAINIGLTSVANCGQFGKIHKIMIFTWTN